MTAALEVVPEIEEVVDLAVEDNRQSAVGRGHRLRGSRAQVYDCQPPVAESDRAIRVNTLAIRTPMAEHPGHSADNRGIDRRSSQEVVSACNPTHTSPSAPRTARPGRRERILSWPVAGTVKRRRCERGHTVSGGPSRACLTHAHAADAHSVGEPVPDDAVGRAWKEPFEIPGSPGGHVAVHERLAHLQTGL